MKKSKREKEVWNYITHSQLNKFRNFRAYACEFSQQGSSGAHIVYVCQKSQTLSNASRCNWSLFKLCIIKKVENDALCWAYRTRPFAFKYHQRTHRYYPSTVKLDVKTSLGEQELHVHLFCTVESHFLQGVYISLTLCLCRFTNVSRAESERCRVGVE